MLLSKGKLNEILEKIPSKDWFYVCNFKKIKTFIHNSIKIVSVVMKTLSYRQKKTFLDSYLSQLIIVKLILKLSFWFYHS